MQTICSNDVRQFTNQIRECSANFCGNYKSLRRDNQFVEAVDLACNTGNAIYAPFDGEITYYQPYSNEAGADCANEGIQIDGSGQWRGYYVLISPIRLYKYGGRVVAGEQLGTAEHFECNIRSRHPVPNYIRVQLFKQGRPIDPTHHLIDCMCTGQICETNRKNAIEGPPFKFESNYNGVRGWELKCGITKSFDDQTSENADFDENEVRAPKIFSPIDGNIIGRIRLNHSTGSYAGCNNEGLFIVGNGKWSDYEVRIYNVRFREELGLGMKRIEQGQHIGERLLCANAPDSIFLEVRFQGSLVDITKAISGDNCQHKRFSRLFQNMRRF